MSHYVKVRIKCKNKAKTLLKLNHINVDIRNVIYQSDYLVFEVLASDIKRIKKYLVSVKVEVIDEAGIFKIKKELKMNRLFIVSIIFGVAVFLVLSNIIVKVNIIHQDKEIREILSDALKEAGVTSLSFRKSYNEYEKIISDIKNAYKDKIEWLEIDVDGMVINVRVEERIINNYEKEYATCHIVASKSGTIKSITTRKGVAEVRLNDYVNKGDILINGQIKLNEEVKENVCASGSVFAEVWYNAKSSMPLKYTEEEPTGKMRFNLMVKNETQEIVILKSRVKEKHVENIRLFKIFGWEVYLQKEYEVVLSDKEYSEEEALQAAIENIHEKFSVKKINFDAIINEKVLKKSVNNGNLDVEMFIAVKEQIGVTENFQVEMDSGTNDETNNGGIN